MEKRNRRLSEGEHPEFAKAFVKQLMRASCKRGRESVQHVPANNQIEFVERGVARKTVLSPNDVALDPRIEHNPPV